MSDSPHDPEIEPLARGGYESSGSSPELPDTPGGHLKAASNLLNEAEHIPGDVDRHVADLVTSANEFWERGKKLNGEPDPDALRAAMLADEAGVLRVLKEVPADRTVKALANSTDEPLQEALLDIQAQDPSGKAAEEVIRRITQERGENVRAPTKVRRSLAAASFVGLSLFNTNPIEMIADYLHNPTDTIHAAATELHVEGLGYTLDDKVDGMRIRDYPDPQQMLDERNGVTANNEVEASAQAVERTMKDLDDHNYDAIRQRAQEYHDKDPANTLVPEQVDLIRSNVLQAKNEQELRAALAPLEAFSGKKFKVDNTWGEVPFADLKTTMADVAGEVGRYPKTLLDKAAFQEVTFDILGTNPNISSLEGAHYNRDERSITMHVHGGFFNAVGAGMDKIPVLNAVSTSSDNRTTFAHEFGHALPGPDLGKASGIGVGEFFVGVGSAMVNRPEFVSLYGQTGQGEQRAEAISGALTPRETGLAHPDSVIRYGSGANNTELKALIDLSRGDPDMVDWLIAQNPNLMDKG